MSVFNVGTDRLHTSTECLQKDTRALLPHIVCWQVWIVEEHISGTSRGVGAELTAVTSAVRLSYRTSRADELPSEQRLKGWKGTTQKEGNGAQLAELKG